MLSEKEDLMLHDIQSMLDSVGKEKRLRSNKKPDIYDGSLTLLVNFGASADRLLVPHIQVEIYSESLGPNGDSLHLFKSIEEAYKAVKKWHSEYTANQKLTR
jgi:hypothetical protein